MSKFTVKGKHEKFFAQRNYSYESATTNETEDQWKKRIELEWSLDYQRNNNSKNIKSIHWAFHPDDIDPETGNPKGLHAHAVIEMEVHCGISQELAKKYFGCSSDANCEVIKTRKGLVEAYRYLTHISQKAINEKKQRYTPEDVHIEVDDAVKQEYSGTPRGLTECYYDMCTKKNEKEPDGRLERQATALQTYQTAIIRGQITADQAFDLIESDQAEEGFTVTDALKAQNTLEQAESVFFRRLQQHCCHSTWCKTTIYVFGQGDKGKSTLVRAFADRHSNRRGFHLVGAKGRQTTFDFADGYKGHTVSIANEVRGDYFSIEQFCDILDPKYAANANSRNTDKFYAPNYVLMNNSKPLETFISDLCFSEIQATSTYKGNNIDLIIQGSPDKDKIRQVRRRFAVYCTIINNTLTVFYRTNQYNPAEFFNDKAYTAGAEPFVKMGSMPFNPDDDAVIDKCVDLIDDAIAEYYTVNNYSVNPLVSGWSSIDKDNTFGDAVILPNADDGIISVEKHPVIVFNERQYEIEDFNNIIRDAVDFLALTADYIIQNDIDPYKIAVNDMLITLAQAGQAINLDATFRGVWLLQFFKRINNLFYNSRILKYMFPDIKNKYLDQRSKLVDADKWCKR